MSYAREPADCRIGIRYLTHCINRLTACNSGEKKEHLLAACEAAVTLLEIKNAPVYGHSAEVAAAAFRISQALRLSAGEQYKIKLAALLHDIGKCCAAEHFLHSLLHFTHREFLLKRLHPIIGADIIRLNPSHLLSEVAEIVICHHARWDGQGYPAVLAGEDIPLGARIISVANAFSKLTSTGPEDIPGALTKLRQGSGTLFDPAIVNAFLETLEF